MCIRDRIKAVYDNYYANEKFVRVLKKGVCPETKWVEGSNYVDVNFVIDERTCLLYTSSPVASVWMREAIWSINEPVPPAHMPFIRLSLIHICLLLASTFGRSIYWHIGVK